MKNEISLIWNFEDYIIKFLSIKIEQVSYKKTSNTMETLDDWIKRYENDIDCKIKLYESYIIRLDCRSFSKFTKKIHKPFDIIFVKAMGFIFVKAMGFIFVKAMGFITLDLVSKFKDQIGYTYSDEITLIFN